MAAGSFLDGAVDKIVIIKSISIIFDFAAAFLIYKIVRQITNNAPRATIVALIFLNLPTLLINSALLGQCDVIFTAFLLAFVYCVLTERPFVAISMFAVALAFKFQAIFLAPFVLYLLIVGFLPWVSALLVPAIYAAMMLPAVLEGRSWRSILMVNVDKANGSTTLSLWAPNIHHLIEHVISPSLFPAITIVSTIVAGLVSLALLGTHLRIRPPMPVKFVLAAVALWVALEPSLLTKMHDHYFFAADVFSFVLAATVPRQWWIAALFQLGSTLACSYFLTLDIAMPVDMRLGPYLGALATIPATVALALYYFRTLNAGGSLGRTVGSNADSMAASR